MKDPAYYRDLIENILQEDTHDRLPQPTVADIKQRKIAHLIKIKKLPIWLQRANIENKRSGFLQRSDIVINTAEWNEHVEIPLNNDWVLEEWRLDASLRDYDVHFEPIGLWFTGGYPLDPPSDEEIDSVMNQVLSKFFGVIVDDCVVQDFEEHADEFFSASIRSISLEEHIRPWLKSIFKY